VKRCKRISCRWKDTQFEGSCEYYGKDAKKKCPNFKATIPKTKHSRR
jgi:hypothetical protein